MFSNSRRATAGRGGEMQRALWSGAALRLGRPHLQLAAEIVGEHGRDVMNATQARMESKGENAGV